MLFNYFYVLLLCSNVRFKIPFEKLKFIAKRAAKQGTGAHVGVTEAHGGVQRCMSKVQRCTPLYRGARLFCRGARHSREAYEPSQTHAHLLHATCTCVFTQVARTTQVIIHYSIISLLTLRKTTSVNSITDGKNYRKWS